MHLAQLNVGRMAHAFDDPRMADFMGNLDRINSIADRSPGFVWRLQDEGGNATQIAFSDDAETIVNMSVWETPEALEDFNKRLGSGTTGRFPTPRGSPL